jgi:hypothetical protein
MRVSVRYFFVFSSLSYRRDLTKFLKKVYPRRSVRFGGRSGGLAFSAGDHQASAHHHQDDADERWDAAVVVCGDAYVSIAEADAVMFGMREGNKKGNDPQHQHNGSDQHEN